MHDANARKFNNRDRASAEHYIKWETTTKIACNVRPGMFEYLNRYVR